MPVPILFIVALAVAGTGGGLVVHGSCKIKKAKKAGKRAEARLKRSHTILEKTADGLNARSADYGALKAAVCRDVVFPVWERFPGSRKEIISRFPDMAWLEDLISKNLQQYTFKKGDLGVTLNTLKGAGTGVTLASGTFAAVGLLAKAGTGTAISALSGSVAKGATLAWLGGGTLASGGAGIAGGTLALTSIAAAPIVLFIGIGVAAKGEKAATEAQLFEADVEERIAEHKKARAILRGGTSRISELEGLLQALAEKAQALMNSLDTCAGSEKPGITRQLLHLVTALCDIMTVPVVGDDYRTTDKSEHVLHNYEGLSG